MSNMVAFGEYAAKFEETLLDDNWDRLQPYFSADATYAPGDGTQGPAIQALKGSVDALERRCDTRELLGEPEVSEVGDTITLKFALKYTKEGLPDVMLSGVETIQYADGLIVKMEDRFDDAASLLAWRDRL